MKKIAMIFLAMSLFGCATSGKFVPVDDQINNALSVGMSEDDVRSMIHFDPLRKSQHKSAFGTTDIWVYGSDVSRDREITLFFENGILKSWDHYNGSGVS